MGKIIYADVLVLINIYINYGLLLLTAFLRHSRVSRLRLILSALAGGFYSLIIIVPDISDTVISASRIPAMLLMVLIGFGYQNFVVFLKTNLSFLGVNIIFAGLMLALWLLISPDSMYYSNGIVYFDMSISVLAVLTVICYFAVKLFLEILKTKAPENSIYEVEIFIFNKKFSCKALYDTGNSLTDPFSSEGVIVVSYDLLKDVISEEVFSIDENFDSEVKVRFIPCQSVTSDTLVPILRADKILVKGLKQSIELKKPIIALTKSKIRQGEYGALLHNSIFENKT